MEHANPLDAALPAALPVLSGPVAGRTASGSETVSFLFFAGLIATTFLL